jgi:hypothetical protein
MKRIPAFAVLAILAAQAGAPSYAEPSRTPTRTMSHGNSVAGVVTRVDVAARTFVVRSPSGVETTLTRTGATRIRGAALRSGDRVAVRWLEKDGKKIATSVRIEMPALATITPTAPAGTR